MDHHLSIPHKHTCMERGKQTENPNKIKPKKLHETGRNQSNSGISALYSLILFSGFILVSFYEVLS